MAETMSKCPYEDYIDRYVKDELAPDEQAEFEKHYFNCETCFARTMETYEVVRVLKDGRVFDPSLEFAPEEPRPKTRKRRLLPFLRRRS